MKWKGDWIHCQVDLTAVLEEVCFAKHQRRRSVSSIRQPSTCANDGFQTPQAHEVKEQLEDVY